MKQQYSHLYSLIEQLCETLAECGRTESSKHANKFSLRKAQEIRGAVEPLAISCLDEEFADLPAVVRKVYGSGSLALVDHLENITDRTCILSDTDWSLLLHSVDPATLNALLDRRLSPNGAMLPMLREIRSGRTRLLEILLDRIAPKTPLDAKEIDDILTIRWKKGAQKTVDVTAQLLRLQVQNHPAIISSEIASGLDERTGQLRATTMILAGLKPEIIVSKSAVSTKQGQEYVERITSGHGLISMHQACGPLEEFLTGQDKWVEWIAQRSAHQRTPLQTD
jgi:hypothetical protein